jgi:hypothetical protein
MCLLATPLHRMKQQLREDEQASAAAAAAHASGLEARSVPSGLEIWHVWQLLIDGRDHRADDLRINSSARLRSASSKGKEVESKSMRMWVDKYRPDKFTDLLGDEVRSEDSRRAHWLPRSA